MPKFILYIDVGFGLQSTLVECDDQLSANTQVWDKFVEEMNDNHSYYAVPATAEEIEKAKRTSAFEDYT